MLHMIESSKNPLQAINNVDTMVGQKGRRKRDLDMR